MGELKTHSPKYITADKIIGRIDLYHHTTFYVTALCHTSGARHHFTALYVTAQGHISSTSISPYCIPCHCLASHFCGGSSPYYILRHCLWSHYYNLVGHTSSTSTLPQCSLRHRPGSLLLQVHQHDLFYAAALGHTSSPSTSSYCTPRHNPGSHFIYQHITILHSIA